MNHVLPIPIDLDKIKAFCQQWKVIEFSFFGSVVRDDFRPDSDVDVLVAFSDEVKPGYYSMFEMEEELVAMFGRRVSLGERKEMERSPNYIHRRSVLENDRRYTKDESRLLYMLLNCQSVLEDVGGLSFTEFQAEKFKLGIVGMPLCRLGFCAQRVTRQFKRQHPEIPWIELVTAEKRLRLCTIEGQDIPGTWEMATKTVPRVIELITPLIPPEDDPRPKPEVNFVSPLTIYRAETVTQIV